MDNSGHQDYNDEIMVQKKKLTLNKFHKNSQKQFDISSPNKNTNDQNLLNQNSENQIQVQNHKINLKSNKLQPLTSNPQNTLLQGFKGLSQQSQQHQLQLKNQFRPKIAQGQKHGILDEKIKLLPGKELLKNNMGLQQKQLINQDNNNSKKYEENREKPKLTSTDLLQSRQKTNNIEFLKKISGKESLEQIQKLNCANQEICIFDVDFEIPNLISLNLANNLMINVIGVAKFQSLKGINLANNFLSDLEPLKKLVNLQKLILKNNKITSISALRECKSIQFLDISKNQLEVFDETLASLGDLPKLQELFLNNNPCTVNRYSYKYDILWNLKLAKLDDEVITERDYQLSKDFNCPKHNFQDNQQQFQQQQILQKKNNNENTGMLVRPSTSHGRVEKKSSQQVQAEGKSLRVQELEKKIKHLEENQIQLQEQNNELLQEKEGLLEENENCYLDIEDLSQQIQEMEQEMQNLQTEAQFCKNLKEENLELRRKVSAYESTLIFKDADKEELGQEIYHLNKQLEDHQAEISGHKQKELQYQEQIQQLEKQLALIQQQNQQQ